MSRCRHSRGGWVGPKQALLAIAFVAGVSSLVPGAAFAAGTVQSAEIAPPSAALAPAQTQSFSFTAQNTTGSTLADYTAKLSYTAGLSVTGLTVSPAAKTAKVDTTKRLITLQWTNVSNGTTLTAGWSAGSSTPGTYTISKSSITYKIGRRTYTGNVNPVTITVTAPDTTPPVISGVQASGITQTGAAIGWTTNEPSTSQVEYGLTTSYGQSTPVDAALVTTHGVALTGLTSGTLYHYRVKSQDAAANPAVSGDFTFTTASDTTPPAPPTGLSAAAGNGQAALSWTANTEPDLAGYNLYRSTTSGGPYSKVNASLLAGTAYTDTGLTNGTTYYYVLRAVDTSNNESANSAQAIATPQPPPAPDLKVTSLSNPPSTAVVGASFSVTDTTTNAGTASAGASTTRYYLSLDAAITGSDTLLAGTRSVAILAAGAGSSGTVTVTIPSGTAAGTYYLGACADDLAAVAESNEANNCMASAATVAVSPAPTVSGLSPASGPVGTSVTINGANFGAVQGSSSVTFNGTAATPASWSAAAIVAPVPPTAATGPVVVTVGGVASNSVTFTVTADTTPPNPPAGLTATPGNTQVILTWTANAESDLAGYNLYRSTTSGGPYSKVNASLLAGTAYTDTGLANGTTYYYVLTAVDTSNNESANSAQVSATPVPPPDTTPPVIGGVQAAGITQTGAAIGWTTNEPSTSQVEYGLTTSYGQSTPVDAALVTTHGVALTGLTAGTLYHYRVKSQDAAANPAVSGDFTFTTASDATPPAAPTGLKAYPGNNQAVLAWTANAEADLAGYKVYRSTTSGGGYTLLTPAPATTPDYSDKTVTNGTTYYYVVSAVDKSGNEGGKSAEVSVVPGTTGPTNVSGVISTDTVWTLKGSPYIVTGTVSVYKDTTTASTLTIEPGVEVRFGANTFLYVGYGSSKGALKAQGTASAPILFTSNQAAGSKTPGYWYRLDFQPGSGNLSTLDYVTVEYGGYGSQGNVYVSGSSPTIKNSTIQKSSNYGVYVTGTASAPVLQSTAIKDNTGIGLYLNQGSLNISSMTFSGTGGAYSMSLAGNTPVTTSGTHAFDKPIELQAGTAYITSDLTWRNLGAPYVSSGTVYVYKDTTTASTLTIEPGVEVRFGANTFLYVGYGSSKGALKAQGTASAPILFTSNQAAGSKTPGYWYRLDFQPGSGSASILDYVTVEYGGYGSQGSVYIYNASPTIKNSTIQQSSNYGVYVTGTAVPVLRANNFVGNATYGLYNATTGTLDARASWWNHASGPSGIGSGTGEKVYGSVLYAPWLGASQNPLYFASDAQVVKTLFNKTNDTTALIATLSAAGNWTLQVLDKNNAVVKTYTGAGSLVNQAWAGEQDGSVTKVADGTYTLRLSATNPATGQAMAPLLARVMVVGTDAPIASITSPASGAVLRGGDAVPVIGTAADTNDFVSYRVEYGVGASPTYWYAFTTDITTPVIDGPLASWTTSPYWTDGTYTLRLSVKDATTTSTALATVKLMTIVNPTVSLQYFSPNGDSVNDTTTFAATLTLSANWTLTIKDSGGAAVRTFTGSGTSVSQVWDGKNASGVVVPDGAYTWTLEAVEPGSGVAAAPKTGTVYVDVTKPVAQITAPVSGATVSNQVAVTGTASDALSFQNYKVEYGAGASPTTWTLIQSSTTQVTNGTLATWNTNDALGTIPVADGTYTIRLTVTDKAGNQATAEVVVTVNNLHISGVTISSLSINPTLGESTTITFTISRPADVAFKVVPELQGPAGTPIRTSSQTYSAAGTYSFTWDGKDSSGKVAPDEAYLLILDGSAAGGTLTDSYSPPIPWAPGLYYSVPAGYDPYSNKHLTVSYTTLGRGRVSIRIGPWGQGWFDLMNAVPHEVGSFTATWDGRNASGQIVTGTSYVWVFAAGGLGANAVITKGDTPHLTLLKSDPYREHLSYGHFTALKFSLSREANVTLSISGPSGTVVAAPLNGALKAAGDYTLTWDALNSADPNGKTFVIGEEGVYTFAITATNPVTGSSETKRGVINVYW